MSHKPKQNQGPARSTADLSHIGAGAEGRAEARMVDVGAKPTSARSALARARVVFPAGVLASIRAGAGPKGALAAIQETARTAAILAAKRTGELIPMCHPLGLDFVGVEFEVLEPDTLQILARASCTGRTGVEMEAMCAASVAALTIYDMSKALAKGIRIESVELLEKTGGKSGIWRSDPS